MHDFDYDVLEKKRIAYSAKNRVNGSRSSYVSLPSDNLTAAEKKKMNGVCEVYKLNRPIPWREFKKLPRDIQIKYFDFLSNEFDVTTGCVAEMFGVKSASLSNWLTEHGMKGIFTRSWNRDKQDRFRTWWQGEPEKPTVEEKPVKKSEPKKPEMAYFPETLQTGQFSMKGTGTEISQTLFGIFRDKRIEVFLKFRAIEEVPVPEDGEETECVPCED